MRIIFSICLLGFLLLFQNCKKDDTSFSYCTGCPISSWTGNYNGTGTYFIASSGETFEGVNVNVSIENTYDSTLVVKLTAENYISESFSTSKTSDDHYILLGSGSETLDIGLKKNDNQYKLDGTFKKNTWNKIDSVWIVNKSLTFSALKQ